MNFHVGQQVVKIDIGGRSPGEIFVPYLPAGGIYTIRDIDTRGLVFGHDAATIRLEGIIGDIQLSCIGPWEIGYDARGFRPVKTTDISIFTKMLAPHPREREPA